MTWLSKRSRYGQEWEVYRPVVRLSLKLWDQQLIINYNFDSDETNRVSVPTFSNWMMILYFRIRLLCEIFQVALVKYHTPKNTNPRETRAATRLNGLVNSWYGDISFRFSVGLDTFGKLQGQVYLFTNVHCVYMYHGTNQLSADGFGSIWPWPTWCERVDTDVRWLNHFSFFNSLFSHWRTSGIFSVPVRQICQSCKLSNGFIGHMVMFTLVSSQSSFLPRPYSESVHVSVFVHINVIQQIWDIS